MNFKSVLKLSILALLVLGMSQSVLAMEKEVVPAVIKCPTAEEVVAAIFDNNLQVVKDFIKAGTDVNQTATGDTFLNIACSLNREEIVKELLENGADPNMPEMWFSGHTPLHMAMEQGLEKIVRMLIEYGADINCKDKSGQSPLERVQGCSCNPHGQAMELLLKEIEYQKEIR
jgi:hypothetical protein